jgi:hypothetical protein
MALTCALLVASPPPEMVIRLTVDPMAAPKPALRYQLLPELSELQPGNPIPNYLKALLDQDFSTNQDSLGPTALKQVDRAARMDKPDWQLLHKMKTDGIGLLLPDLQKMRQLANDLSGRFRDEIALRRFDDALVTAKTMFALARHTGEHPTLIGNLVGLAIAFITMGPLEEMLQQQGCPNLYWALTNLPAPLISIRSGLDGERALFGGEVRELDDTNPMTPEQIKNLIAHIDMIRKYEPDKLKKTTREWLSERVKDSKYLAAARERLIEYGIAEERLARFPADQIVLLDEKRTYEVRRDEMLKFMNLPTWEAMGLLRELPAPKEPSLFDFFLPVMDKVRLSQGRLEQRIAMLRHVEAVRMYAAAHDGKLPEKLGDVGVPLPLDPFTGKAFRYEVADGTAHVRGTPPKGYERMPVYNIHYEIRIRQ